MSVLVLRQKPICIFEVSAARAGELRVDPPARPAPAAAGLITNHSRLVHFPSTAILPWARSVLALPATASHQEAVSRPLREYTQPAGAHIPRASMSPDRSGRLPPPADATASNRGCTNRSRFPRRHIRRAGWQPWDDSAG